MDDVGRIKVYLRAGGNIVECKPVAALTGTECNICMPTMIYLVSSEGV